MALKTHRLFVGNIPAGTSEQELSQEFAAYGNVESIEIKTKTNPLNDTVESFGFVTLQTEDHIVPQCIKEFQQQKYKGTFLKVSKAKESFLEKLKREREEAEAQKKDSAVLDPYTKPAEEKVATKPLVATLPTLPTLRTGDASSSSESSESESEEETPASPQKVPTSRPLVPKQEEDEIVKKWNQETYIEYGKLKILPVTGKVADVIDRAKPHQKRAEDKKLSEKARIADEKRKQGLNNLKSAYEQQQLAIKSALAGGAQNSKKKITFDDDENDTAGQKKLSLFDGEEDDDGFKANFSLRKQMLGEEGQKLYEMQTSFQADNRFRLDSRFLDDADKKPETKTPESKAKDKERMKQLEILSNVTGKPIITENRTESKNTVQMQRFDPLQQKESDQNEDASEPAVKASERKKAERREDDFKVSEEKFYKVSDSFTTSSRDQGFSLLAMFGKANESKDNQMEVDEPLDDKPLKSDARFRYESSDSEDEQSRKKQKKREVKSKPKDTAKMEKNKGQGYYTKQGIWKEFFFFLPSNDTRLEAGREFLGYVPDEDGTLKSAKQAVAGLAEPEALHIRQLYAKRRYREVRFVQKQSKLGLRRLTKKSTLKRTKKKPVK